MTLRIALTGATGMLGRSARQWWTDVEWIPFAGEIRDAGAVRHWIESAGAIDLVLHLAAIVPIAKVESDPRAAFEVNVQGTWNVMDAMRGRDAWIFLASSSHVYMETSLYGITKKSAEDAALAFQGARLCIGRIFSVGSPLQAETYLLPSLVKRIRDAEPHARLTIRGGNNVRDFLTTRKIVEAIHTLHAHDARGMVDIGSGVGISVLDLARRLAARMGRNDLEFITTDEERTALIADPAKLRALGWDGSGAVDELLAEMAS